MRRALLLTAALLGLCATAAPSRAQDTLIVGGFGGELERALRTYVFPKFEADNNVHIEYVAANAAPALARLQAQRGKPDMAVIMLDDGPMYQAISLGLCAPVETPRRNDLYDIANIQGKAVGVGLAATGLGYNTKVFAEHGWPAPTSWTDLGDPKYRKLILVPGLDTTQGIHMLVTMARINGGSEDNIDPGFKAIKATIAPNVLSFEGSPGQITELFQNGEVVMSVYANSRIRAIADAGLPLAFVYPKEKAVGVTTSLCPVQGGPSPAMAQKFLDYMVQPDVQVLLASKYGWGPTNRQTQLDAATASRVIYGPDQIANLARVDWDKINPHRAEWTRRWQREIAR